MQTRKPSPALIDAAEEWLKETRVEEALNHLYDHDNGDRLRRILSAYEASDRCEGGNVLFDILDAARATVTRDEAQQKACDWLEYGDKA